MEMNKCTYIADPNIMCLTIYNIMRLQHQYEVMTCDYVKYVSVCQSVAAPPKSNYYIIIITNTGTRYIHHFAWKFVGIIFQKIHNIIIKTEIPRNSRPNKIIFLYFYTNL